jgi:glycosyltransferase involved in cell wall biosynthesis
VTGFAQPIKILHVVATSQRRGAEVFASDLVRALGGSEVEQSVAILRAADARQVEYHAPTTVLGPNTRVVRALRFDPRRASALRRLVARLKPHIVQAHGGEALKYSAAATLGHRTRVVYRRIGGAPPWLLHGPRRVLYSFLMRRTARVVAVADSVRDETIALFGLQPQHVVTIPNAVDPARVGSCMGRADVRRSFGIPPHSRVLLSIGAMSWEKDPLTHVAVGARTMRLLPDAMHVMVGDGPMRAEVEDAIRRNGLDGRVIFLGERRDVGDVFAAADLLLFASRSDGMEGMPAIVIEAGMAGLPVVGYGVAGVSEVVDNDVTGILVPAGDRDALAGAAVRLLGDVEASRGMGDAALARCHERFSIVQVASEYLGLYADLARDG